MATPRSARTSKVPEEIELDLGLDEPDDEASLKARAAQQLRTKPEAIPFAAVRKRSIDARQGRVKFHVLLALRPDEAIDHAQLGLPLPRECAGSARAIVVGDGPAGLFCAYELARAGVRSIVLDRGKQVQPRRHDLKGLQRKGTVNPDSNYCFGEGGAGTYSDGKLYTRAHKRGDVRDVIETLALHGAPEAILVDARPHIGSNKLPKVITAMRERLEACGVEFRFESKVVDLEIRGVGSDRRVAGVRLASGEILEADHVVLATGHSARDVFHLLLERGVRLEAKPFALGVRIEHPQPLIDRIQYGGDFGHPKLPAAYYRLAHEVEGRGVFSFCMCPGGWIVPASTEPDGLVVNGMSLSRRDSPFANSGLVVGVEPSDWQAAGFSGVLGGVDLQRAIEVRAMHAGGDDLAAPATPLPEDAGTDAPAADATVALDAHFLPVVEVVAAYSFGRGGFVSDAVAGADGVWHHQYGAAWHPDGRPVVLGTQGDQALRVGLGDTVLSLELGYAGAPHAAFRGDELLIARPFFERLEIADRTFTSGELGGGVLVAVRSTTLEPLHARDLPPGYRDYLVEVTGDSTFAVIARDPVDPRESSVRLTMFAIR